MRTRRRLLSTAFVVSLITAPAWAADTGEEQFRKDFSEFVDKLATATHGAVTWDGSDSIDYRQDGDAAVAVINNGRIALHKPDEARITFNKIELRRSPASGGDTVKLAFTFPTQSTLTAADGTKVTLTLKDATAAGVLEQPSGRVRETTIAFAGARLEHTESGNWASLGPLALSSKLVTTPAGGWTTPIDFEVKQLEFFVAQVPIGGAVDRIAYSATSSGPDLAGLNRLHDRIQELQKQGDAPPEARIKALLDLLPTIPTLFSVAKGELSLEGLAVRAPTGEPFVSLTKASFGGELSGMSGDAAALRLAYRQDGLGIAPMLVDQNKVPRRAVLDFGVENVATAALRTLLEAAGKFGPGGSEADQQQATGRMLGALAMLNPTFRIYDAGFEAPQVGLTATAEAKGLPFAPKGYTAEGDVLVRGFDALPSLIGDAPYVQYLPLLKTLGTAGTAPDQTKFHLASAPQKWITINGNDVIAWFGAGGAGGQPRVLHPAEPPMSGDDVRAVQRALASAGENVPQSGQYDGATAAAVARFQKRSGLNVDGSITEPTREKLGIKAGPGQPAPQQPGGAPPRR